MKKANRVRLDSMHEIIPRIGQTTFWEIIVSSSFSFLSYTFIYIYIFSFLNSFSHISFLILLYFSKAFARYEDVLSIFSSSFSFFFFFFYSFLIIFLFFFNYYYYYYSRVCTYVRVYVDANETRVNKWCNRKIDECAFCRSYFPILSVLATFWSPIDRCPL